MQPISFPVETPAATRESARALQQAVCPTLGVFLKFMLWGEYFNGLVLTT